jgi:uncharacterized membrane protein YhaH (DUF805 family)
VPLDWKSLFSGRGRVGRRTFWTVQITAVVFETFLQAIMTLFGDSPWALLTLPFAIGLAVVSAFNMAKRLHDLGHSGWWMLAPAGVVIPIDAIALIIFGSEAGGAQAIVALVGLLVPLVFIIAVGSRPGQAGPNRFGDPPGAAAPDFTQV